MTTESPARPMAQKRSDSCAREEVNGPGRVRVGCADASTSEIVSGSELGDLGAIFESHVQLATAPLPMPREVSEHLSEGRPGWQWRKVVPVDASHQPDVDALRSLEASSAPGGEALRASTTEVLELIALLFDAEALGVRVANATRPPCPPRDPKADSVWPRRLRRASDASHRLR